MRDNPIIIRKNTTTELIALMEYKANNITAKYSSETFKEIVLALKALERYENDEGVNNSR